MPPSARTTPKLTDNACPRAPDEYLRALVRALARQPRPMSSERPRAPTAWRISRMRTNRRHSPLAAITRGKLLTAAEVADRCGTSLRSVRRWLAAGDLVAHRLGRSVRVAEADLERFLAACKQHEK